ncbi:ComEC/Rec2 family competence protein [Candidatus Saccharibacteria bacterium]|nr:ComEC/Rec2 family competence protein [Candidatus Saccharibacteria bacterium]
MWQKYNFLHPSWLVVAVAVGIVIWSVVKATTYSPQERWAGMMGQEVTLSGQVVEDPDTSASKTTLRLNELELLVADGNAEKMVAVEGAVFAVLRANKEIKRSDRLTLRGKLSDGFGTFSATMYRPSVLKLERAELGDTFLAVRDYLADKIREVIPEPESALGLGYLLGVRSSLPEGLSETLKIVGLTHIIVASGANLSILIGFARKIFGKISRAFGLITSLALTAFYVGMVGLSPSMVRAGLVAGLSLATWYVGRKFEAWRLLLIVAGVTLIYNPMYWIDLGWLLSFGSFAGILVLGPALTRFFYGAKKPGMLGATLLETVAASLLCTPILLYFFGTTSLISLLANLLILPTIAAAMALTFATGVLAILGVPILTVVVGKIATLLLSFHLAVINFLGKQEIFLIEIPPEQPMVFLLYLPIILMPILIAIKNYIKISKGDGRHQDRALEIVDTRENVTRQFIQRHKIADSICHQDGKERSDERSLNDAKQAKETTTA